MKKILHFVFWAPMVLVLFVATMACVTNGRSTPMLSLSTVEEQRGEWDKSYGGADKSYDAELLGLRNLIAPRFQTFAFDDSVTGKTMIYNLYIPEIYDKQKNYPLVLFMADGSTVGKKTEAPLMQGYGGIIWATDETQLKNPCFVLAPAYAGPNYIVNDDWEVSDEVDITLRLLEYIVAEYNIDKNRLYATGQSMGCMIAFYLNANHPDLFAASVFVGGQWDVNVLGPLARMKFFYIVSAGDPKASVGMETLGNMLKEDGVTAGITEFAANLPYEEQENHVRDLLAEGRNINFVRFTKGTVAPGAVQGSEAFIEHMYSFDRAYKLESVRNWLFEQKKVLSK
jgi:predicted peptidase